MERAVDDFEVARHARRLQPPRIGEVLVVEQVV
jgi:hypothetical protein